MASALSQASPQRPRSRMGDRQRAEGSTRTETTLHPDVAQRQFFELRNHRNGVGARCPLPTKKIQNSFQGFMSCNVNVSPSKSQYIPCWAHFLQTVLNPMVATQNFAQVNACSIVIHS